MSAWKYIIGALAAVVTCATRASCLDYGPTSLTGRVVRQTYAGPPDYESVTKGDRPIVIYLLQFDQTLCVNDSRLVARGMREIQLESQAGGDEPFRELVGRKITVTGELIRGGARHDNRVVLVVAGIATGESGANP